MQNRLPRQIRLRYFETAPHFALYKSQSVSPSIFHLGRPNDTNFLLSACAGTANDTCLLQIRELNISEGGESIYFL